MLTVAREGWGVVSDRCEERNFLKTPPLAPLPVRSASAATIAARRISSRRVTPPLVISPFPCSNPWFFDRNAHRNLIRFLPASFCTRTNGTKLHRQPPRSRQGPRLVALDDNVATVAFRLPLAPPTHRSPMRRGQVNRRAAGAIAGCQQRRREDTRRDGHGKEEGVQDRRRRGRVLMVEAARMPLRAVDGKSPLSSFGEFCSQYYRRAFRMIAWQLPVFSAGRGHTADCWNCSSRWHRALPTYATLFVVVVL